MDKVNLDVIKPWITKKLIEILGVEDDVVMQYVLNMLESEKVKITKNTITMMQNVRYRDYFMESERVRDFHTSC